MSVTPHQLQLYRTRVAAETSQELQRHPPAIRYALLAAFCYLRSQEISDNLFDPWGKVRQGNLASTGTTTTNYTGQKLDGTGLLYYNARYYDPGLGKFISPDTLIPSGSPQNLNRYSYVSNNPINRTDVAPESWSIQS